MTYLHANLCPCCSQALRVKCGSAIGSAGAMGLGGAPEDPEAEAPDALLWKSNLPNVGMQGPCALKDTTFRLSVLFCFVFLPQLQDL